MIRFLGELIAGAGIFAMLFFLIIASEIFK